VTRASGADSETPASGADPETPACLSLIVLTCDEERNLGACLESVRGLAEEIFVVDSGSSDRTREIALRYTDHVVEHPFENQARQFNWALDHLPLRSEWVLRLDADEYLLPELREEISASLPGFPPQVTGLYMKRRVIFRGRWIRHGGFYPTWLLRLFRRGKARSEFLEMDEHLVVLEGETRRLEHDFVDENRKGLAFWTRKHEAFAEREARILHGRALVVQGRTPVDRKHAIGQEEGGLQGRLTGEQPERRRWVKRNLYDRSPLFARALAYFLYRYILRAGFLDGMEGLVFHVLQGFWYRFYVDAKLWELRRAADETRPV